MAAAPKQAAGETGRGGGERQEGIPFQLSDSVPRWFPSAFPWHGGGIFPRRLPPPCQKKEKKKKKNQPQTHPPTSEHVAAAALRQHEGLGSEEKPRKSAKRNTRDFKGPACHIWLDFFCFYVGKSLTSRP